MVVSAHARLLWASLMQFPVTGAVEELSAACYGTFRFCVDGREWDVVVIPFEMDGQSLEWMDSSEVTGTACAVCEGLFRGGGWILGRRATRFSTNTM